MEDEAREMTPTEALFQVMSINWMTTNTHRRYPKPGQLVEAMPTSVREALSRLTSDEAAAMAPTFLGLDDIKAQERADKERYDLLFTEDMKRRRVSMKLHLMWAHRMKRAEPLS